jgi:hypothetical protein
MLDLSQEAMLSLSMEQLHDGWLYKLLEGTTLMYLSTSIELDIEHILDQKIQLDTLY